MTHPHEDHFKGLWRLLDAFQGRVDRVWRPPDNGDRYVKMWIQYLKSTPNVSQLPDPNDVGGLARLVSEMGKARANGARFKYLQQGMLLLEEKELLGHPLRIHGCGPSSGDLFTADYMLNQALVDLSKRKEKPAFDPNAASGALVIRWGHAGILLGGDLLCADRTFRGWDEVHDEIEGPIQVVKAAHHASLGAHHAPLLDRLQPLVTLVTPFQGAVASQPPRPEQIAVLARNSVVAITAEPKWPAGGAHPRRLYGQVPSAAEHGITSGGFLNDALDQVATAGEVDAHNAIAVSLDATGKVLRFVLAGRANVYEPEPSPAAPPG